MVLSPSNSSGQKVSGRRKSKVLSSIPEAHSRKAASIEGLNQGWRPLPSACRRVENGLEKTSLEVLS